MYNIFCMVVRYLVKDEEEEIVTVVECSSKDKDFAKEVLKDELVHFKDYRILSAVLYERIEIIK